MLQSMLMFYQELEGECQSSGVTNMHAKQHNLTVQLPLAQCTLPARPIQSSTVVNQLPPLIEDGAASWVLVQVASSQKSYPYLKAVVPGMQGA